VNEFEWTTRPSGIVDGRHVGELFHKGRLVGPLRPSLAGEHNLFNVTMAVAACAACGVDPERACQAVAGFTGVDRRMTEIGQFNGATIVDDYGHHPTEIQATLAALRERYSPRRVICIFQPHQHSRTRFLLQDFAASFSQADETVVPDIYFVRDSEAEKQRVSSNDLVERIKATGQSARHIAGFADIVAHLRKAARAGDLIVTMGAGNVWEIGRELAMMSSPNKMGEK
jgi:UDP-N-acetylmuramate--alanine ligase